MASQVGPLRPPGQDDPESKGPGPAGMPVGSEATPDPNAEAFEMVAKLNSLLRRFQLMFPATVSEVRSMQAAAQRIQQKIVASRPGPEPMAPPV